MAAGASVVFALAWAWAGTGCLTVNAARPRLPSGAGGHSHDADRLRIVAELHGYDGWLLGCRDKGLRRGRQQFMVTLLEALGAPSGTIGAGLAAAGVLRCAGLHAGRRPAMSDDAIGPDGTVRLRCYVRHATMHWFAAGCPECGGHAPIGVRPAIRHCQLEAIRNEFRQLSCAEAAQSARLRVHSGAFTKDNCVGESVCGSS